MNLPSVNFGFHRFYLFIYFVFSLIHFFFVQSSHETLNVVEEKKQAEVGKDERVITEEMNGKEISPGSGPGETRKVEPLTQKDSTSLSSESSSSESEDEVGEYRPHHRVTEGTIREEQEYEGEVEEEPRRAAKVVEREEPVPAASPVRHAGASVSAGETGTQEDVVTPKEPAERSARQGAAQQGLDEDTEEELHRVNGEVAHVDVDVLPQIICCSEVNWTPKWELTRAVSQVESTCLSSTAVLPVRLQLFQQEADFFLSWEEVGKHTAL